MLPLINSFASRTIPVYFGPHIWLADVTQDNVYNVSIRWYDETTGTLEHFVADSLMGEDERYFACSDDFTKKIEIGCWFSV